MKCSPGCALMWPVVGHVYDIALQCTWLRLRDYDSITPYLRMDRIQCMAFVFQKLAFLPYTSLAVGVVLNTLWQFPASCNTFTFS